MELQRVGHNWATFTFFLKLLCYTFVFIQFIFFKLIFLVTSCLPHILFRFLFTFKTFENFLNTFLLLTCCSLTKLCPTLCDPMDYSQATLFFALSWSFLKFMSIELVMPSSHLILCFCFLLLPSSFPSSRVFFSESALCIRWPKYWSFSFSISPSNDYSGLISFTVDWLDLLVVQGTFKNLLQHYSSKASILWGSPFCMVQLSQFYVITGKTIALTI